MLLLVSPRRPQLHHGTIVCRRGGTVPAKPTPAKRRVVPESWTPFVWLLTLKHPRIRGKTRPGTQHFALGQMYTGGKRDAPHAGGTSSLLAAAGSGGQPFAGAVPCPIDDRMDTYSRHSEPCRVQHRGLLRRAGARKGQPHSYRERYSHHSFEGLWHRPAAGDTGVGEVGEDASHPAQAGYRGQLMGRTAWW